MSQGRHGIKVLGLSLLAALGLMAFAASAQAGEYLLEGSTFTSKGLAKENVEGTIGKGKLLVPGLLTVACTGGTASGTVLLGGVVHATLLFSGCEVEGNKFCKTFETKAKMESETEPGFLTASGLGEIILMGGKHYILVESTLVKEKNEKGEEITLQLPFSNIYLTKSTKGCTLPLEEPVAGSTVLLVPNALTPSVNQTLGVLTQAELETLVEVEKVKVFLWSDRLTYGNQLAWLDEAVEDSGSAHLSGANVGKKWGGE